MKVTREMIDNDKKIVHINYTKEDIRKTQDRIRGKRTVKQQETVAPTKE